MAEQKPLEENTEVIKQVEETFLDSKRWLPDFIEPYWQQLQEYPWMLSILVLFVGYGLAKLCQWLFRFIASHISKRTKNNFDDQFIPLLSKTIFSIVFFSSIMLAVDAFQFELDTGKLLKRLVMSILVLSLMVTALKGSKILLQVLSSHRDKFTFVEERTMPILNIVSQLLLIGAFSYFLILLWGKDPTAWLASAGVIGIAVGFAAKDTLANLFAGFFIVADSPYKLGDYIVLDSGERGKVAHVGIRSTRLMTRDDIEVTIPNSVMGNAKIVNQSGGASEKMRVRIGVSVAYESDLEHVVQVLEDIAKNNKNISQLPTPRVRARNFAASGIDFQLMFWIDKPEMRGQLTHKLMLEIHQRFKNEGIEIPYSKQDLYIKNVQQN